ncbi:MAG: transcriptional repressor [Actinobacteria bacterium]|nr:transcriptional repressor [Actinomycetota bacterium]
MGKERLPELLDALRRRGERLTTARHALLSVMAHADEHLSADQLSVEVARTNPAIHRATIYRTLETLRRLGIVEHTHLGHGPAVYHLADDVHQHLVCEECGWVVEAPADLFAGVEETLERDFGFDMRANHFAIVGRCRRCAEEGTERVAGDRRTPTQA